MEIREIVKRLNDRAEEVSRYLIPAGRREGQEWIAGDPSGNAGKSFKIHLSGAKAGWCKDFASDWSGDLLDVWCESRGVTLAEALKQATAYLGIADPIQKSKRRFARPQRPKGLKFPTAKSPVFDYLTKQRKISQATIEALRIGEAKIGFDFHGNKPKHEGPSIVFPYLRQQDEEGKRECFNIKYLLVDRPRGGKVQRFAVKDAEMGLFGWQAMPPNERTCILCEGEIDQATWLEYGYHALSMPNGIQGLDWIENEWENLERFETIYISVDNEETSQKQVPKLFERLGFHRCLNIELPFKDINKCLLEGVSKPEIDQCYQNARPLDPEEMKAPILYLSEVIERFYRTEKGEEPGFSASFETRLRFRPGEFTILAGEMDHGKTTIARQVILDAALEGFRTCYAGLEDTPPTSLYKFTRTIAGEKFPSRDEIERILRWENDWLKLFTVVGTQKTDRILSVFEYAFRRYNCWLFVLDNLTKLDVAPDDYAKQQELANKLSDFAIKTQGHVILLHHTRKGDYDRDLPDKRDIKGSGGIPDISHNTVVIWRRDKEAEEARRTRRNGSRTEGDAVIHIIKQKNADSDSFERRVGIYFHPDCYVFTANREDSPMLYIDSVPKLEPVPEQGDFETF